MPDRGVAASGEGPPSPPPLGSPGIRARALRARARRALGFVLIAGGLAALTWTVLVWQWRDPFTSLYTTLEQRRLAERYEALAAGGRPTAADSRALAAAAERYHRQSRSGDPIGRLTIGRLGLDMVLVNGTDQRTLKKGPGRDLRSFMPGEGRLVYVAGHRTTYLAPFARIERLRPGDLIDLEVPYGVFSYQVIGHRVVERTDLSVLESPRRDVLRLQACHPRFFASHRYVVFARAVGVETATGSLDLQAGRALGRAEGF
jgi:sortase A